MVYLIMVGCSLFFLITCLIFCFVPIISIDRYPTYWLDSLNLSSAEYNYSVLDILEQPKALVSFILVILSVILVFIMLIKAFKVFDGAKYNRSMGDYIFSTVSTLCVLVFTIFVFLLFTSNGEVDITEGFYAYYKNQLVTFILLVIFSVVALLCSGFAFVIKTINMFIPAMGEKKFFKMSSGKEKQVKIEKKVTNEREDFSIESIEMLEKLHSLKEKGIISEEEFKERKAKMI